MRTIGYNDVPVYFYREDEDGNPIDGLAETVVENAKRFTLSNRCNKLYKAMAAQVSGEIAKLNIVSSVYGKDQAELIRMKSEAIQSLNELRQAS